MVCVLVRNFNSLCYLSDEVRLGSLRGKEQRLRRELQVDCAVNCGSHLQENVGRRSLRFARRFSGP